MKTFKAIYNNICKAYDDFYKSYAKENDALVLESLEDFDDDYDFDLIPHYDEFSDRQYVTGEVMLSPKSFYDNLHSLKESVWEYDFKLADRAAVDGTHTVLAIAKKLNIEKISEHFELIYMKGIKKPVPAFIKYKTYCELSHNRLYSIAQMFAECGYFLSKRMCLDDRGIGIYVYQFEPYYFENEERCYVEPTLYHMTAEENYDSILEKGFIISHKNDYAKYPPRNYFFRRKNIKLMIGLMYRGGKLDKFYKGLNDVVIIHIDTRNLKNVHFYSDPNYWKDDEAVYCYENVPPAAIIKKLTKHMTV